MNLSEIGYRRVVVKLGTSVLTSGSLKLDKAHMVELARQMACLMKAGVEVVLCTSGAIAAGKEHLGYPKLPDTIASKQLLAAVGQSQLILAWSQLFSIYGLHVGQLLLTRADLHDRERYLNARDSLNALLNNGIIPIINENDAVATAEIKVGDNDNLSARAALLCDADLLILLTDQKGLFDADPRKNPDAKLITEVQNIDDSLRMLAGGAVSGLGTGGMATKLEAADIARRAGVEVVIASGHYKDVIQNVVCKKPVGTHFTALEHPLESRKQWILAGPKARGQLVIDAGAIGAVTEKGRSLLSKGITEVKGLFQRGDTLELIDTKGKVYAKGMSRYSSADVTKLAGKHSDSIEEVLGYDYGDAVVHRNDMVVL
ncbi:glutamate 5-kinase [Shewanella pealeana]|uniref:Glutamate 5-kinase n=1 Tax=Shewanella pealeana (strain ATCC 700345 / ANG-SQ1) TaxID=398579 RepID=PROB_SHEPA|nr:glutamate 5-kinase [Shewanella pealeana]A8H765.1 RecName: Full=Glutamate 5-kinase; AltName: Full=Gamma-glutamyl kinase; Short=GK [Shewanella pealeana ATCC 700345]ABV88402.1 glutamate 5-kinase [Shewanella pealeana ATCC 700345]